jgi:hypothetical protein
MAAATLRSAATVKSAMRWHQLYGISALNVSQWL